MDNKKRIRDLTNEITAPSNDDWLVLDNGTTNKVKRSSLLKGTPLPADTVDTQAIEDEAVNTDKLADEAVDESKRSGGVKMIVIPGATLGSTGNKAITGVGFKPKEVEFHQLVTDATGSTNYVGTGYMNENGEEFLTITATSSSNTSRRSSTNYAFGRSTGASDRTYTLRFAYVSMDADGFTIDVDVASSGFDVVAICRA